jgi:hypothetical protein
MSGEHAFRICEQLVLRLSKQHKVKKLKISSKNFIKKRAILSIRDNSLVLRNQSASFDLAAEEPPVLDFNRYAHLQAHVRNSDEILI